MKVLFATADVPWQGSSGGKLRDLATYRAARAEAELTLVCFPLWSLPDSSTPLDGARVHPIRAPRSVAGRVVLRAVATLRRRQVFQELLFRAGAPERLLETVREVRPDVVVLGNPLYDGFLPLLRPHVERLIVDLWELRADGARDRVRRGTGLGPRLRAALDLLVLPHLERDAARHADEVWMVSRRDAERYARRHRAATRILPTTIDAAAYTRYHAIRPGPLTFAFVGVFHYDPNVAAAVRLLRRILPRVRERRPDARLALIGRAPPTSLRALVDATPHATLHADVPDATELLASSGPLVAPLETGTGMRTKFLEAAAARVPIVTNRSALAGVDLVPGREVLIAESDDEFADAVVRLWDDGELTRGLVERAHARIVRQYDTAAVAAVIARSLRGEPEPVG